MPTTLALGLHTNAFSVRFDPANESVVWSLRDP
jgi:hypothetical protein